MPLTANAEQVIGKFVNAGFAKAKNSQKGYRNDMRKFEKFLNTRKKSISSIPEADITEKDFDDFLLWQKDQYSHNTISRQMVVLSKYFKWCKSQNTLLNCPRVPQIRAQDVTRQKISSLNIDQALEAWPTTLSGKRNTAMLSLMVDCGLNTVRVVSLNMDDINWEKMTLTTRSETIFFETIITAMKAYLDVRAEIPHLETNAFFVNNSRGRISDRSLRRILSKQAEKLNIPHFNPRDLQYIGQQNMQEH